MISRKERKMNTLKIKSDNKIKEIKFSDQYNLSQILIDNNIFVDRACGGKGTCGKCAVRFLSPAPAPGQYDKNYFSPDELALGLRLSCKTVISTDALIEIVNKNSHSAITCGISSENEIYFNKNSLYDGYGIAIDLGTTTIVVYLVDLKTGNVLDAAASVNPQRKYGDNVITRSDYIHTHEKGLEELRTAAMDKINELIKKLTNNHSIDSNDILRCVLSGNTIMQHIVADVDPYSIAVAPYTPAFTYLKTFTAVEFGLNIHPDAQCFITNSISGFVGGDIVSGIIATGLDTTASPAMLIDIGTNGEMVLSNGGKMYSCSVAAGPAFEGEHIKFGVGGISGAINKVYFEDNRLEFQTIDSAEPVGICGAGLLDVAALLVDKHIIDENGTMDESKCDKLNGELIYYITKDIYVSQKDIREIQLAKAAVAAGAEVLIKKAGIAYDDIETVYLSGGFGTYLNVESAVKIGLINKKLKSKCIAAGNSSGMGSIKSLLSDKVLNSLSDFAQSVNYIELSFDEDFNDLFVNNMIFRL